MNSVLAVVAALMLVAFSGCVLPLGEGAGAGQISRRVVMTLTESTMRDADGFEDVVKTSFEYRHEGGDVSASELTVEYLGSNGQPRTRPMSTFASQDTLRDGDLVTIGDANFTSGLVVRRGAEVVAERTGLDEDWYRIENVPIPMTAGRAGEAVYAAKTSTGFDVSGNDFDLDEAYVHKLAGTLDVTNDGQLKIKTTMPGQGPRVEFDLQMVPKIVANFDASVTEEGNTYDVGMRTEDMRGSFDALGVLQFDQSQKLQRVGGSYDLFFDGRVYQWDDEHPKSENYQPPDLEHPMLDEEEPYQEEDADTEGEEAPQWVVQFLTRLWNMQIGVGDDYRLHAESTFGDGKISFDLIIQVAGQETRPVGATAYPAHRVTQVANLMIDPAGGAATTFDLVHTTYWLATGSNLPVYSQTQYTRSFSRDDVQRFLDAFGDESPISLPKSFSFVLRGEETLQLISYSGDLMTAPIIGVLFGTPNQFWGMGPGWGMRAFGDMGYDEETQAVPMIGWANDESNDKMTVTHAPDAIYWGDFQLKSDRANTGFALNDDASLQDSNLDPAYSWHAVSFGGEPVFAGDYISFCGPVGGARITLMHVPTNSIMHEVQYSTLTPCAP